MTPVSSDGSSKYVESSLHQKYLSAIGDHWSSGSGQTGVKLCYHLYYPCSTIIRNVSSQVSRLVYVPLLRGKKPQTSHRENIGLH